LIQILKPVIDYTSLVIDYQRRFFRKLFPRVTSVQKVFEWPSKVYLYMTWNTNLLRVFQNKKVLSSQKEKLSYPLKNSLANTLAIQ